MALIPFFAAGQVFAIEVAYVAEFPRNKSGDCAFCEGDPCAERPDSPERIHIHMRQAWAQACPVCNGRAS